MTESSTGVNRRKLSIIACVASNRGRGPIRDFGTSSCISGNRGWPREERRVIQDGFCCVRCALRAAQACWNRLKCNSKAASESRPKPSPTDSTLPRTTLWENISVDLPLGYRFAATYAGIRKTENDDLGLIVSGLPAAAAG